MAGTDLAGRVDDLVTWATGQLRGDEVLLAGFSGEEADFVRFNNGAVRQAGSVSQRRSSSTWWRAPAMPAAACS